MIRKIMNFILWRDFSRTELKAITPQITEENRKFCIIWSVVHDLFWTYCLIMSFINPLYRVCRTIYAIALAASTMTLVSAVCFARKHARLIQMLAIILDAVLLLAGVFIARNLAPKTIVVFAAVLITPVAFITNTISTIVLLMINIIVFTQVGSGSMDADSYVWVLSNLCIFSAVGIMMGHFVNKARFERYIFAESNAELARKQARYAHHDQLTDLPNRRAYAETVDRFAKELPPDCRTVIADINGLKEMNDVKGHSAGDELITGAAECLRKCFPDTDRIYRIGGDEFCVIVTDAEYDIEKALDRLRELSADWKGRYVNGISISAGYASAGEFTDIDTMLKTADRRMYESKRKYYESTGRDRRRR